MNRISFHGMSVPRQKTNRKKRTKYKDFIRYFTNFSSNNF